MTFNNDSTYDTIKLFESKLLKQKGMSKTYFEILMGKFKKGSDRAKNVFLKYVPDNSVIDPNYTGAPHYDDKLKAVKMNFRDDMEEELGAGTVYFHEHGHLIDCLCGREIFGDTVFLHAVENDFYSFISKVFKNYSGYAIEDLRQSILYVISGVDNSAAADLFSALSGGYYKGDWGHDNNYWKNEEMLRYEAFAHFFEAQFCAGRNLSLKRFFPNANNIFIEKLKLL